ncbi:class I SAM-dependent methyltransferase [Massilibacteroides sp.]|uniref:class I SAM-dependent methyltransferase n=1 Tax=Massilibacteroides sp. TaxID=2034766 RepID=UPI00262CFE1B|nr:class I SAM-dependent methyltransferase [Massilibacteroides sp.]MDD4516136.1 class I SAM-dependent methyltransferase [Massilibacteroides sp.]
MSKFWNERYDTDKYVYGVEPNHFFKESILHLPAGNILLPAEGEGRNAVFAAQNGWTVEAFDQSEIAQKKAFDLAKKSGVRINYRIDRFETIDYPVEQFDVIALIYAHLPSPEKTIYFRKLLPLLKKGGYILFEGFSKDHRIFQEQNKSAGGPKEIDMLYSKGELSEIFQGTKIILLEQCLISLDEGVGHNGSASVIRMIAQNTSF